MSLPGYPNPATLSPRTVVSSFGGITYGAAVVVSACVQAARIRLETPEGDSVWTDGSTAYVDGLPSAKVGAKFEHAETAYEVVGVRAFSDPDLPQYTRLWLQVMP